jgi:thiol:disulfide interchange protein
MARTEKRVASGSQSWLSPLFWVVLAAILLWVVTAVSEKRRDDPAEVATLVRWAPLEKAADASRSASRAILYDFTAAWCLPCHLLDREGWNDPRVAELVHESFVPTRVMDRLREDGKNSPTVDALQRRYGVGAFPTLVVASAEGREIAKFEGYRGREALVGFLKDALAKTARAVRR